MDTLEAMNTSIAMRYLTEEPVPRDVLTKLVHAATRASNPGNSQAWEFVIIDDADVKAQIGEHLAQAVESMFGNMPDDLDDVTRRMYEGAKHLAGNFAGVPAWILGGARKNYPPNDPQDIFMYSSVYPAAQNLVVAARSMNIGTTFTTFQTLIEPQLRGLLHVPDEVHLLVFMAVGYPARRFSKVRRKPVEDVMHWNGW